MEDDRAMEKSIFEIMEKKIPHYLDRFNIICWDTPAHGMSRPYRDFTYFRAGQNYYHSLSPYSKKELCHLLGIGYAGFLEENCDLNISCPVLMYALYRLSGRGLQAEYAFERTQKAAFRDLFL